MAAATGFGRPRSRFGRPMVLKETFALSLPRRGSGLIALRGRTHPWTGRVERDVRGGHPASTETGDPSRERFTRAQRAGAISRFQRQAGAYA